MKKSYVNRFFISSKYCVVDRFFHKQYGSTTEQTITYDGDLPVNITDVNRILINCSIAPGSYSARRSKGKKIYSFLPDIPPGSFIQINPRQVIYYPLHVEIQITEISMQLTDQSGRQLDLNNEVVTYYLHLRAQ